MVDETMRVSDDEFNVIKNALSTMKIQNTRHAKNVDNVRDANVDAQDNFHAHNAKEQSIIEGLLERLDDAESIYIEPREN